MSTDVSFPLGFKAWGVACGIKKNGGPDLGVLVSEVPALAFGAFTSNVFKAAPVLYCQDVINRGKPVTHVLVNSGNANACTGSRGQDDVSAEEECLRRKAGGNPQGILISSTGVIGEFLPMEKVKSGIDKLFNGEPRDRSTFIQAIMTTDTMPKQAQRSFQLQGMEVRLGGVAKGAGMIRPNMATMLAYITTDISLEPSFKPIFQDIVHKSFNSISVDGDMSTNDSVLLLANGQSRVSFLDLDAREKENFEEGLLELCRDLARQIVKDGEGATKLVNLEVRGARTVSEARIICQAIAGSPLVKTAFFGGDPNWGRVIAAAGAAGVDFVTAKLNLEFCGVKVLEAGSPYPFDEAGLAIKMREPEVSLLLDMNDGPAAWKYWTCDLSYDYIKINASYRS